MRILVLFFVIFSLSLRTSLVAQQNGETPTEAAQKVAPDSKDKSNALSYLISSGDTVDVVVARRPELAWRGQVNSDGDISALPYLEEPVHIRCRTETQAAEDIGAAYAKLIKNPNVTVRVIERSTRPAILLGAVRQPQRFQLRRDVRLNELLFVSGGVTDRAGGEIQIFRPEPTVCPDTGVDAEARLAAQSPLKVVKILDILAGHEEANPIIRPGDIVTVMVAGPIYITGGVASPQAVNYRDELTLLRAIAMAGGLAKGAKPSETRIYRRSANPLEHEIIKADYDAIKKQQRPDIPLKAYDIIEIPQSSSSSARRAWLSAAQEIITDEKQSSALPLRVIN